MPVKAAARARSNIALVKYWGKRDARLNLPAVGSLSVTLDGLWSETEVEFDRRLARDSLSLDGRASEQQLQRVSRFLDILREQTGIVVAARVESRNNFPTGAGLASSASGFAALAAAASAALGLELTARELSILARRGSGSAARSVFGGFVEMHRGQSADGSDSFAEPLLAVDDWPLEVLVAVTARGEKSIGSADGMTQSAATGQYYESWVEGHAQDMTEAREAIVRRDFEVLAAVAEASCLKMHAAAMSTRPGLVYWNGVTVECLHLVRHLRQSGVPVFFTIDAGPQLKAICEPGAAAEVRAALEAVPGVLDVITTRLGPGIEIR